MTLNTVLQNEVINSMVFRRLVEMVKKKTNTDRKKKENSELTKQNLPRSENTDDKT